MWVTFLVSSLPPGTSVFLVPQKSTFPNSILSYQTFWISTEISIYVIYFIYFFNHSDGGK